MHDFVGESQFQWLDRRIAIVNDVVTSLPEELRWDSITQQRIEPIVRRLCVTSSPTSPLPRVAPRSKTPSR